MVVIGVNISERKSGTERTKKRKKRELVCFPTARGCNGVHRLYRSVRYMEFVRPTITRDIFIPAPMQCGLCRSLTNRQNTQHFTSLKREFGFVEHWKMVAESSEFHLTLKRAHIVHFFQLEIRIKSGTF